MTRRFGPAARSATERRDLHAELTQKIVAEIEAGAGEFKMPWHRPGMAFTLPVNALTGIRYRGSNILWLWMSADDKKYEHQVWATYRQWSELSAQVHGGEKGTMIVKYGEWVPSTNESGQPKRKAGAGRGNDAGHEDNNEDGGGKRLYAKAAHVFNIDQVDAPAELRSKLLPTSAPRPDLTVRMAHVDAFLANTGAEFREGGARAFYRHRTANGEGDYIQMPPRNLFIGTETSTPTESYESTRLHEAGHYAECLIMPRRSLFCRPVRATSAACRHNLVDQHDTDVMRERGRCHSRKDTFVSEVSKGLQDFPARRDAVTLALAFLRTCLTGSPWPSYAGSSFLR